MDGGEQLDSGLPFLDSGTTAKEETYGADS
jgi:hypothetical protein